MGELETRLNVNVTFRRSKPYLTTSPTVAMGEGRMYASAARKPPLELDLEGVEEGFGVIVGVFNAPLRLDGSIVEVVEEEERVVEF